MFFGKKRLYKIWFLIFFIILFAACLNILNQRSLFFWSGHFLGNDFFNVLRYIAERDPYNNPINGLQEKIYLPLSYLILYPLTYFADYSSFSLQDCWHNNASMVSFIFFTVLSFALWAISVFRLLSKHKMSVIEVALLVCTSIFFYSIERGNLIVISAALTNFYICYFDHDELPKQIFAIICISLASVLKIFPAVLILLSFIRKDYKLFVFYIFISSLLSFLPFLFFKGGFSNFEYLLRNVAMHTDQIGSLVSPYKYGISGLFCNVCSLLGVIPNMIAIKILNYLVLGISICASLIGNKKYRYSLLLCIPAAFQLQAYAYNCIYLLPAFIIIINNTYKKERLWFILLFIVINQPVQFVFNGFSFSYLFSNFAMVIFWVSTILLSLYNRNNKCQNTR